MIIFLYGPDDYRRHKAKKEIAARSEKNHKGARPSVFNLENKDEVDNFGAREDGAASFIAALRRQRLDGSGNPGPRSD